MPAVTFDPHALLISAASHASKDSTIGVATPHFLVDNFVVKLCRENSSEYWFSSHRSSRPSNTDLRPPGFAITEFLPAANTRQTHQLHQQQTKQCTTIVDCVLARVTAKTQCKVFAIC